MDKKIITILGTKLPRCLDLWNSTGLKIRVGHKSEINFISQPKHMLRILKRTVSKSTKTFLKLMSKKIFTILSSVFISTYHGTNLESVSVANSVLPPKRT